MAKQPIDYSVYLVTDSTPAILGANRSLVQVVEQALRGGASVVQLRDKKSAHQEVVATARELHALTRRWGVPLLINDRVDVAAEVGCEGVHVGQDDMNIMEARNILGHDKIIGVSARSPKEALAACEAGADYLGIGAVYATATKTDTPAILGPEGVQAVLSALVEAGYASVPTVAIGGIDTENAMSVLSGSQDPRKGLDGVAVVSAIISASEPMAAAQSLHSTVLRSRIPNVIGSIARTKPLSHNMTNLVVQNFAANVALAIGASPIMSNYAREAPDLAKLGGALVINMGTVTPEGLENYVEALKAYNDAGRPVVLDPVGAGATSVRREAVKKLLSAGRFAVIKGNVSEMLTVYGANSHAQRGVDSSSTLSLAPRAFLARAIARLYGCISVITGETDVVSDGRQTIRVDNGHELLGAITGSGCSLGTVLSAAVAAYEADLLLAAVAAVATYGVAAQAAAVRTEVRGPGTFVPAFLDELHVVSTISAAGGSSWQDLIRAEAIEVEDETSLAE
ncbi:hypothetical protein HIM_06529 [Hirsutella minnesotensis 3608]|uniref:Thiamine phosphate synthase/TenI domain-containing protein n=1 Tax=Hirsutella minnesotensis 3608 TaxID=1043627 RepID=A0A0F7ZNN9_9HYPO|nr:hypothetical protein HIM_06529 [Hirsutella minnesotensis 3608]